MGDNQSSSNIMYSKVSQGGKEKYVGFKITNLNDLKKATPRLKFPSIVSSSVTNKTPAVSKEIKQKLLEYCRTCAGLKVPLVDIFSEKGVQMRLEQQMQHLENIDKDDSLSTQMCMDCICDLKMSYKFFMQIKKAELKLKTISQSLNDTLKSQLAIEALPAFNEIKKECLLDNSAANAIGNFDVKSEPEEYDCTYLNESNDGNESFEEFDPDDAEDHNETIDKSLDLETSTDAVSDTDKILAYKFDKTLNAYIKISSDNESQFTEKQNTNIDKIDKNINKPSVIIRKETLSQSPVKSKILKRKLSPGVSNESVDNSDKKSNEGYDNSNKKNKSKVNIDIVKELKIPKLDLEDTTNIKKADDGVMYVTAKGSKPNEMLLIKVKKVIKTSDKKLEKVSVKKKSEAVAELLKKFENERNKGKDIDKQIEEYKKRRSQILGDNAIDKTPEEKNLEIIRAACGDSPTENKTNFNPEEEIKKSEKVVTIIRSDNEETILVNEVSTDDSEQILASDKLKQRWKDIKQRYETINKDLAEDHTERLKAVLKQKDEDIEDFKAYLKLRKIVVSRLQDADIISLYEHKNNVILEKAPAEEPEEELVDYVDPFEVVESYECDFCNETFLSLEEEFEHAKEHDFRLMHYCEDCGQEFITHKAKRSHNITCVQKLMCKYCDMILESKGKKRQHEQKHCDDQYGQLCDLCGERFKHQGTLDQHVKSRHMNLEKVFKCPQCTKKFAFRTKLTFHLKSVHTNNRPFLCEDCGCNFKNPASLRHHRIRKHAPVDNKKECHICKKLVPVYGMSKHMHTHKAYTIKCDHCDKMFKNTSTLKQHLRIHEDQRQYKCDMCGVGFNRRDGLRLHLKVHEKPDSKGLKECVCQVCNQKFPSHSMLVIHRNREHKDGRNYTCHICNRSMISTRSLEWHMAHIHNEVVPGLPKDASTVDVETKRVTCTHCGKNFKTEMILRTHIKNTHTEKEPMKCLDCEEMFMSEVRWKHHMMTIHGRLDGTLECPHCTKRFVNQLRLKTHMISHSDERPHTCDICGFMLKTKVQLIKHKQNRHSNERPLQCKYCNWRCKQVSALVCHERTHTNERPYQCSVCKQRFKYLGDKNKHERRHEVLGGTGFKRIVTGRNTSTKVIKKRSGLMVVEQDPIGTEAVNADESLGLDESQNTTSDYTETNEDALAASQLIKFEDDIVNEESGGPYEQIYVTESDGVSKVVIGMEGEYTEEVTSDNVEHAVLTGDMLTAGDINGHHLYIPAKDANGQTGLIQVYLTLDPDDQNSEVSLATDPII
ncbi:uncharacterized protein LOC131663550 [Phymastichus coffea]|uniref:uncharacterized protein LOC131663550 n=1 Tax=Phymastichus coffea TaxID=108790 RepID=UPI00273B25A2|nr:uncharacterized protein LOC131663550 [Phymastichus coffea]